jgi:hypothetical protein
LLILLFKNVLKITNFEKSAKTSKNLKKTLKKQREKTSIFFLFMRFYAGGKNFTNKKGFSIKPFFCISIQPQHTVDPKNYRLPTWEELKHFGLVSVSVSVSKKKQIQKQNNGPSG